jgi:hypothetical protein
MPLHGLKLWRSHGVGPHTWIASAPLCLQQTRSCTAVHALMLVYCQSQAVAFPSGKGARGHRAAKSSAKELQTPA